MNFRRLSKIVLLSAAATALSSSVYAQGHPIMPGPVDPGDARTHAWVADVLTPNVSVVHGPGQACGVSANNVCYYNPIDIQTAYAVSSIAHGNGGAGMTVAVVDAYYNSQTESDLAIYSAAFGLPACTIATGCLTIVGQTGTVCPTGCTSSTTFTAAGWALETDLDIESVHAMAPNAHILLVTANSASFANLGAAVLYAQTHADVVTNSYGANEGAGESALDTYYSGSAVPILFSAGDTGAVTEYPCVSTYVVCVGGTHLIETATSFRNVEGAWGGSDTSGGGGGGCSSQIPQPSFQSGFATICGSSRGVPDVAALADEYTGWDTYLGSFAALGLSSGCTPTLCPAGGYVIGGTSLASPLTAGIIAVIDGDRVFNGKSKLGANLNALLYQSAATSYHYRYYDSTTGTNGFTAVAGWDRATGLGVILGPSLAAYLVTLP